MQAPRHQDMRTHQETDGALKSPAVDCGLWMAGGLLRSTRFLRVSPGGRRGDRLGTRRALAALMLRELLARSENLVVVPVLLVVLERAVERGELALDYELGDYRLVPVPWTGVDALWGEIPEVDRLFMVPTAGRGTVAHRETEGD